MLLLDYAKALFLKMTVADEVQLGRSPLPGGIISSVPLLEAPAALSGE
jgi:hypothetical protein